MTYQHEQAIKAIKNRATAARDLAEKLERYAEQLTDDREVKLNDRYEWAINDIENFTRNLNFAELARHARNITN